MMMVVLSVFVSMSMTADDDDDVALSEAACFLRAPGRKSPVLQPDEAPCLEIPAIRARRKFFDKKASDLHGVVENPILLALSKPQNP